VIRSFEFDLNKKFKALAMMAVLTAKHREGNLHIFDRFTQDTRKTKDLMKIMRSHGLMTPPNPEKIGELATPAAGIKLEEDEEPIHIGRQWRVMFVCNNIELNLVYAAKNVQELIIVPETHLKLLDLIRFDVLCVSEGSIARLQHRIEAQYRKQPKILKLQKQAVIMGAHAKSMQLDLDAQKVKRAALRQQILQADAEAAALKRD
jgi:DNA polymerase III psi subunit